LRRGGGGGAYLEDLWNTKSNKMSMIVVGLHECVCSKRSPLENEGSLQVIASSIQLQNNH